MYDIKYLLKTQAILDVMIVPETESWRRLVSYYHDDTRKSDVFRIDNGEGDHLFVVFSKDGVIAKGFYHESCLSRYMKEDGKICPKIYDGVPDELLALLDDGNTERMDVTFCLWKRRGERKWNRTSPVLPQACLQELEDGAELDDLTGESELMSFIFENANDWFEWASVYYELREEAWDVASTLYETGEITSSMIEDLNPELDYDAVIDTCDFMGLFDIR